MTTAAAARNAIVRGERIANRGPGGGRSYATVKGLLNYLAFGRSADRLGHSPARRSPWLDHNAQEQSHAEVLGWAKEKVHRYGYGYTYQLLLSTREGGLESADYNRVLMGGSALSGIREWIYTVHEDTDHQHAHAVLFRKEKLSAEQYREWQATMQEGLEQALATQAREQGLEEVLEGPSEGVPTGVSEQRGQQVMQAEQQAGRGRRWGAAL
jgi:hypothetical protein